MKPRTKHVLRQAAICLPIALAAGWTIAGTIIPLMGKHFWTGAMYVMITAICFDMVLKMVYPKFAWTRPYEPPATDPNDPKRINFINVGPKPGTTYPSEQELMKFCGPDENLRKMYLAEWRKINVRPWVDGIDDTWLTKTLAERQADNEEFRKLFFGDWVPKHPIHRYASTPRLEDLLIEIDQLGYGDAVFEELQNQRHLDPYLLTSILINFITMVKVNPNEKAIFKPFPETHA